jgi:UDP-GlcNAc:undecaprenyl-phosphate GlcNAc-1-phosphate transferase
MFQRFQEGRSPFAADRNHLHHYLLDAGFGPMAVALGLMAASLAIGLLAAVAVKLGVYRPLLVIAFLVSLGLYYRAMNDRAAAVAWLRGVREGVLAFGAPRPAHDLPMAGARHG